MNILMINRNNPLTASGAVAHDLFNEFKAKGNHVKLLVNIYDADYPDDIVCMETFFLFWKNKLANKVKRLFRWDKKIVTDKNYHFHELNEQTTFYKTEALLKRAAIKPDVIIVLFAKNFINAKNMYELHQITGKPIYWLMYDTAPLTGGCHYSWDCLGYQNYCGNCPGLYSGNAYDITNQNMMYKKKYFDKTDISIVLASEWQHLQASKSSLFREKAIHKILIGINHHIFKPVPKESIRNKFGIAKQKKVIFFGAKSFIDDRKGFKYLSESLKILKEMLSEDTELCDQVFLLTAGEDAEKFKDELPFENLNLGMLNNSDGVASAYQAADIYLCPSIEDAGPSMVNQSIMCGTPVVSFAQGVSLDIVITGKTGYRARLKDSADMAKGMYEILKMSDGKLNEMKNNCRELAMELFHPDICINKWLKIINTK